MEEEEIREWLRERLEEGEYATAETFIHDVFERHNEYHEGAEARMREYEEQVGNLSSEIDSLKARNYDLLQMVPASEETENLGDGVVVEDVADDGTVYHIDNLFTDNQDNQEVGNAD